MRTGLRSVVLRRDADPWGRSFEFVVNGIPIFAKGASVVPFESFPSRATTAQIRYILQSAKDANMNMVRIWGGGYYETKEFYDICDELGIMVWQDFMFGNPWQPGNYAFKQNVAQEVTDQLKRLRNHPSIVLWCGNNEQENNFLQDSIHVTPMARLQMWTDYLTVFSGIIPTLVARYDPATPYWPSSPSGNYAETKDKNYWVLEDGDDVGGNQQFGDTHDYTVGTSLDVMPRVPFSSEEDRHYRFISEYGFQSLPDMQTIDAFTLPKDRVSTSTAVMQSHEKGANGYNTIREYMLQYYGATKGLCFPGIWQPGAAGRIYQIGRRTSPPRPSAHDGLSFLATERLLAGGFVVEHRLLRALEGSAILCTPLLQSAAGVIAHQGWEPGGFCCLG